MEVIEEKGPLEDYTQDGTVDLQGRPVLRSKTGRWKACSFLVGKLTSFTAFYRHSKTYSIFPSKKKNYSISRLSVLSDSLKLSIAYIHAISTLVIVRFKI